MTDPDKPVRKDLALEALRGCAAWVVVAHHFLAAFRPGWTGFPTMTPWNGFTLTGTPFIALVNGSAAVLLFFVLSGYVLTLRYFETGRVASLGLAMVKRWPRLAGPATVATVCSALLWMAGAFHHREAAALTSSVWLDNFASTAPIAAWTPSLYGALAQGAALTFFRGDNWYDINLWTMRYELIGSYLSWAVAIVLLVVVRGWAAWVTLGVLAVLMHYCFPSLNAFIAGVVLARAHRLPWIGIPARWTVPCFVLALLMLSFEQPSSDLNAAGTPHLLPMSLSVYLHIAASVLLILLFAGRGPWHRALDNRFGKWLGWMSFAVYLTHPLVILSASSLAYLRWSAVLGAGPALAAVAALTVGLVVAVSTPLAAFDARWARAVSALARRLLRTDSPTGSPA